MSISSSLFGRSNRAVRKLSIRLGSGLLALGLSVGSLGVGVALPAFAADPFRTSSPHDIGELTEAAFQAIFRDGDYEEAQQILQAAETAEADEPLVHAMLASMAYLEGDAGLEEVARRATLTREAAEALVETDPLRGHLYTAVGVFLEGAYVLQTEGVAKGTPRALGMLQTVFSELDAAERIDPTDSELNLLKGYMDLMLAVNLPFSNPEEAISRMDQYGNPVYLTQRGIAIGYRDLAQYDAAMIAVDKAIAAAPENPELFYLKAQLHARLGNGDESVEYFNRALAYEDQLPENLVRRITWEGCIAEGVPGQTCSDRVGY
ncbi:MAG: Sll0314/Alr1548 family TPR repeat-containing protein [Cyanobacteria bacterium J06554_11]